MATRRAILILGCVLSVLTAGFGQQAPSGPKTVVTPEQPALPQQVKQAGADRGNLRNEGQQAFDAERWHRKRPATALTPIAPTRSLCVTRRHSPPRTSI